jgi:fatty acid desaturase
MSRIQRINDESLDHLVAVLRYSSLVALLAAVVGFFLAAALGSQQLALACVIPAVYAVVVGYLGWWTFGNSTWRQGSDRG